ncbi:hypothetical protein ACIB24_14065 [Spongisporangium articulatum]|uniref:DUF4190 domain-containing protein n=1 Tax=Spongisporangium articulatum TaxID=3362603 RepID=A0ABW8AP82_9ACTN
MDLTADETNGGTNGLILALTFLAILAAGMLVPGGGLAVALGAAFTTLRNAGRFRVAAILLGILLIAAWALAAYLVGLPNSAGITQTSDPTVVLPR